MASVKELLNKVQEVLVKQTNPLAIILFGSYSRNTQNVDSDIDIAIKAEKLDRKMLFNLKQELEEITSKDIDLIDLKDIIKRIKEGGTIYGK